ncbi:MAG TPA: TlpA disulfide reductase family protein [Nitrosomonas sp.]|nr:TlpA disulfide reductase family protein [Nitrosomonas sp.]
MGEDTLAVGSQYLLFLSVRGLKNPSRELKVSLLFEGAMEAQRNMDEVGLHSNYELLKDEYPDIWYSKIADRWIMVNIKIKCGASIPPFAFKDMVDSTVTYTHSSLKGKIYLLDFWATWCLACIGEIPYIQRAYEKYHSKGLEIISVSSDIKQSDVATFRAKKEVMPWRHVWISESEQKMVHDQFEVTGIPKPILIDQDGTIVGLKADVRGEKLQNILAKVFKEE